MSDDPPDFGPLHAFVVAVARGRSLWNMSCDPGERMELIEPCHLVPISAFSMPVTILGPDHWKKSA